MSSLFGRGKKQTQEIEILAWEDDPRSGTQPIKRPKPDLRSLPLKIRINATTPPARVYNVGTPQFRYWATAEALQRGLTFWSRFLPEGTAWQTGQTLQVWLVEDPWLNAYYDRCKLCPQCQEYCKLDPEHNSELDPDEDTACDTEQFGLSFFRDTVHGTTVYTEESPDVVCHELGHAILDALCPELFCAQIDEVAAFHESFGDMSAILSALQLPSLRGSILEETGGWLYQSSRLSRLAEQLGWAIRQLYPDKTEQDCLRNAVNSFFYRDPKTLAPDEPVYVLSAEAHSFSRVFTGAFFEALSGMFEIHKMLPDKSDEEHLLAVSQDMGQLLVDAIGAEESSIYYFSQVAGHMIKADTQRFGKRYFKALRNAFVRHGILSLESVEKLTTMTSEKVVVPAKPKISRRRRSMVATKEPAHLSQALVQVEPLAQVESLVQVELPGARYGLGDKPLLVQVPRRINSSGATPESIPPGFFTLPKQKEEADVREAAARNFVDGLFIRGKVEVGNRTSMTSPFDRKTHMLIEKPDGFTLVRILFE